MRKIFGAFLTAALTFGVLNFIYSNLGGILFNQPLYFRFSVPYLFTLRSTPVPLGFVVIAAFCLGILFLPLLQLIPKLFRTREIRVKDRRIRELESELESFRSQVDTTTTPGEGSASAS